MTTAKSAAAEAAKTVLSKLTTNAEEARNLVAESVAEAIEAYLLFQAPKTENLDLREENRRLYVEMSGVKQRNEDLLELVDDLEKTLGDKEQEITKLRKLLDSAGQ